MSLGEGKHSFLSYDLRTAKGEAQFGNNQIQVSSFLAPVTQPGIDKTEVQKRQEAESLDFSNVLLSYPFWAPVISEGNSVEYDHKSDPMRISSKDGFHCFFTDTDTSNPGNERERGEATTR